MSAAFDIVAAATQMQIAPNHEPTVWLADQLEGLTRRIVNYEIETCHHANMAENFVVGLWEPNLVYCTGCAELLLTEAAARSHCDRCHAETGPVAAAIYPLDAILVVFRLCAACHQSETAT